VRDRFNAYVERHDVAWEVAMAVLALLYVAIGFAIDEAEPGIRPTLEVAELGLTAVFVLEFASRFAAARDRLAYVRGHWIDVVALIPPIRGARVLRVLRLLRLVRMFAGAYRAALHLEGIAKHRGVAWVVVAWLAVMGITAAGLYIAENGVNAAMSSPFDALWWGISTMTTVGYGDVYPQTPEGRIAAMTLMLLGIGLWSAVTAAIASYFISEGRTEVSLAGELERLAALRDAGSLTEDEFAGAKARLLGLVGQ
jgi:voltage-gated potassium channel